MNLGLGWGLVLPREAGQMRAGARFRRGFLCQNQPIAVMQTKAMIIRTFI